MHILTPLISKAICDFLIAYLTKLTPDWWQKNVITRLTFQQQRQTLEKNINTLADFNLSELLRILEQNTLEISNIYPLPKETKYYIQEMQTIYNKWENQTIHERTEKSDNDKNIITKLMQILNAQTNWQESINKPQNNTISTTKETTEAITEAANSQALFSIGEIACLRSNNSTIFPILGITITNSQEYSYMVFQNNVTTTYYERQIQKINLVKSETEILNTDELHACLTAWQLKMPSNDTLLSLRAGRVKFVPYQYRPVLKIIRADRPRLLIADEVGVGKTIETGLIIKELHARMNLQSILIICPKSLVSERKWQLEMQRFDETFTHLDSSLLKHCINETHLEGEWPNQYAKSILSFSLFDDNLLNGKIQRTHGLLGLNPAPKFDLVIVDEAHHIRNSNTFLHQGIKYFCDHAEAVVFLSATPVQMGSEDLYTLLQVLRPDLIPDKNSFHEMLEPNKYIHQAVRHCRTASKNWEKHAQIALNEAGKTRWGKMFICENQAFQKVYDKLYENPLSNQKRIEITSTIEKLNTFSHLMSRTRRRDIGIFTTRNPETISINFTSSQQIIYDNLLSVIRDIFIHHHGDKNIKFMMSSIQRQASSCIYGLLPFLEDMLNNKLESIIQDTDNYEQILQNDTDFSEITRNKINQLINTTKTLNSDDPKVNIFIKNLKDKALLDNNKTLVFSTFRHTLAYLSKHCTLANIRFGLIHGNIADNERRILRQRFALDKQNPQALDVLLSSEVGCEGLDFQFCDCLINYDLPWNPMRIEQRIGRIDRYGQQSPTIVIINLITDGTVESRIYERCLMRIGVFQNAIGGNEEILGEITSEIKKIGENFYLSIEEQEERLRQLSDNRIRQLQEEEQLESQQAELFGLNIPNQEWSKEIKAAENYWLGDKIREQFLQLYLNKRLENNQAQFTGNHTLKTLRLNQEARYRLLDDFKLLPKNKVQDTQYYIWEKWLKDTKRILNITFDQETANTHPDTLYLSTNHPFTQQAAQYFKPTRNNRVQLQISNTALPNGSYEFAIYHWCKTGLHKQDILIPISHQEEIQEQLFTLLEKAHDHINTETITQTILDRLDERHHSLWLAAQANHIQETKQQVESRIQSLSTSHRIRIKKLNEQIQNTNEQKIQRMRKSELERAEADFALRMRTLQQIANSGDIHSTAIIYGTINITKED